MRPVYEKAAVIRSRVTIHHRVIDDRSGVITAVETTPGSIAENKKLMELVDQHEKNMRLAVQTVVADHKYGTNENYVACQDDCTAVA